MESQSLTTFLAIFIFPRLSFSGSICHAYYCAAWVCRSRVEYPFNAFRCSATGIEGTLTFFPAVAAVLELLSAFCYCRCMRRKLNHHAGGGYASKWGDHYIRGTAGPTEPYMLGDIRNVVCKSTLR